MSDQALSGSYHLVHLLSPGPLPYSLLALLTHTSDPSTEEGPQKPF